MKDTVKKIIELINEFKQMGQTGNKYADEFASALTTIKNKIAPDEKNDFNVKNTISMLEKVISNFENRDVKAHEEDFHGNAIDMVWELIDGIKSDNGIVESNNKYDDGQSEPKENKNMAENLYEFQINGETTTDTFENVMRNAAYRKNVYGISVAHGEDIIMLMDAAVAKAADASGANMKIIEDKTNNIIESHKQDSNTRGMLKLADDKTLEVTHEDSGNSVTEYVEIDIYREPIKGGVKPIALQEMIDGAKGTVYVLRSGGNRNVIEHNITDRKIILSEIQSILKESNGDVVIAKIRDSGGAERRIRISESAVAKALSSNQNLTITARKINDIINEDANGEFKSCQIDGDDDILRILKMGLDDVSWAENFELPTTDNSTSILDSLPPYANGSTISEGDMVSLAKHPGRKFGQITDVIDRGNEYNEKDRWNVHIVTEDSEELVFYPHELNPYHEIIIAKDAPHYGNDSTRQKINEGDPIIFSDYPDRVFGTVDKIVDRGEDAINEDTGRWEIWVKPDRIHDEIITTDESFEGYSIGENIWMQPGDVSLFEADDFVDEERKDNNPDEKDMIIEEGLNDPKAFLGGLADEILEKLTAQGMYPDFDLKKAEEIFGNSSIDESMLYHGFVKDITKACTNIKYVNDGGIASRDLGQDMDRF